MAEAQRLAAKGAQATSTPAIVPNSNPSGQTVKAPAGKRRAGLPRMGSQRSMRSSSWSSLPEANGHSPGPRHFVNAGPRRQHSEQAGRQ